MPLQETQYDSFRTVKICVQTRMRYVVLSFLSCTPCFYRVYRVLIEYTCDWLETGGRTRTRNIKENENEIFEWKNEVTAFDILDGLNCC